MLATAKCGTARSKKQGDRIDLVVLDGRTGNELHGIFFGPALNVSVLLGEEALKEQSDGVTPEKHADWRGRLHIDANGAQPRLLKVWLDFIHRDCRFADPAEVKSFKYDGSTSRVLPLYSIDEIVKTGIVEKNFCGAASRKPRPGELVVFAIPASFKELWYE